MKFAGWAAKRVICSRLLRLSDTIKKINNVEAFEFTKFLYGRTFKRIAATGGADVVNDCVGMDGKNRASRIFEQKLKLADKELRPYSPIATKSRKKIWNVSKWTGVYGGNYNAFPLVHFGLEILIQNGTSNSAHVIFMPGTILKNNK